MDIIKGLNTNITSKYTFKNFIVDNNNIFAYNASLALCNNYGNTYNPIFFYGENGSGKTHLINAIKNKIIRDNPKIKVMHISFENLIRKLVDLRENNEKNPFEKEFDCIDILIIEDIIYNWEKIYRERNVISFRLFNK